MKICIDVVFSGDGERFKKKCYFMLIEKCELNEIELCK